MQGRCDGDEAKATAEMPTVATLEKVTELARARPRLFVRWSRGPDADAAGASCDDLTGVALPGLSANPLAVEPWWGDRPLRLWIARRLYDYSHLGHDRGPGVRPQFLSGEDEARLSYLAVHQWYGWSAGRLLILDIGGGSMEIVLGRDAAQ